MISKAFSLILFLFFVVICIKFSLENLEDGDYFIKIGWNGKERESSLILETGRQVNLSSVPVHVPIPPTLVIESEPSPINPIEVISPSPIQIGQVGAPSNPAEEKTEEYSIVEQDMAIEPANLEIQSTESKADSNISEMAAFNETDLDQWESILVPKLLSIRHVWGDQQDLCMPFSTNYTTLQMEFAPYYCLGKMLPMLDLRGHRFDDNTYAANIGFIGRYIPDPSQNDFCELLGFNAYYDYRQGYIGYYNQLGAGLEVLSQNWDFRANAYVPFGPREHMEVAVYDSCYTGGYTLSRTSVESISYSFNAEIGVYLFNSVDFVSLYLAGGPYFIARAQQNGGILGGEVRLRPQYRDYLAIDGSWRYDSLFEEIWQIEVILNLPLYQIRRQNKGPCGISDRQIYQPVQRFEVLPLSLRNRWFSNF